MPRNNRGGNRGGRNNNPEGRNQYSSGWMDSARDRPFTAAATAAAAVGAGVFLWSRRNQISEQLSNLSDQISDWSENMRSGQEEEEFETIGASGSASTAGTSARSTGGNRPTNPRGSTTGASGRARGRTPRGMSETGGGNASLGAHTGSGIGADEV